MCKPFFSFVDPVDPVDPVDSIDTVLGDICQILRFEIFENLPRKLAKKHSVSTIRDLMIKVKKGSGEYRKIIASRRVFFSVITMFFFLKFRSQR